VCLVSLPLLILPLGLTVTSTVCSRASVYAVPQVGRGVAGSVSSA
jgi:hypothetical protein